jgi:surface antigen
MRGECLLTCTAPADQPSTLGGNAQRVARLAAACGLGALLAGCGAGGFSLEKAEVDRTLYTSSASATVKSFDADRFSDETTIRNAVTSADIETLGSTPLPWANAGTGARGQISSIAESKEAGALCRRFSATRENFDGVTMYRGEACTAGAGVWRMHSFEPL